MIKEELLKNARKLHLDTHQEVLDQIASEWEVINKQLDLMRKIDISNVEPMVRPVEKSTSFLRDDVVKPAAPKKLILSNSPSADDNFIIINKESEND